jgi:hypothetical protein
MLRRLGKVLYWVACIAAGLTTLMAVLLYTIEGYAKKDGVALTIAFLVIAFAIWLAGLVSMSWPLTQRLGWERSQQSVPSASQMMVRMIEK